MKVVAFVPAKGSSVRVPSKNVTLLMGKPLVRYAIEKLMSCEFIDEVYIDTESDAVFDLVSDTGCRYMKRDPALATNATDGHQLFYNEACLAGEADVYVQVLGTSPFVLPETIRAGIEAVATEQYDSALLAKFDKLLQWDPVTGLALYDTDSLPNSFELPDTIYETTGLYIANKEVALGQRKRHGIRPLLMRCSPIEAVDINLPEDFAFAEVVMRGIEDKSAWGWC